MSEPVEREATPPPPYSETAEDGQLSLSWSPLPSFSSEQHLLNLSLSGCRLSLPLDMQQSRGSSMELMGRAPLGPAATEADCSRPGSLPSPSLPGPPPLQLPGIPRNSAQSSHNRRPSWPMCPTHQRPVVPSPSPWHMTACIHPLTPHPPIVFSVDRDLFSSPRMGPTQQLPARLPPLLPRQPHLTTSYSNKRKKRKRNKQLATRAGTTPPTINL